MDNLLTATHSTATDIRAARPFDRHHWLSWPGKKAGILLLSDVLALVIAGRTAAHFNQFYSPLPPPLQFGRGFGLPGIYWLLIGIMLLLFAHKGLYTSKNQWKNYLRSGKLVSLVFLAALILGYFYDPKLAPPRSLVLTGWLGSMGLVITFRLLLSLIVRPLDQAQTKVFLLAPADRLPILETTLQRRSKYRIVGQAAANTSSSTTTMQAILTSGAQEVLAESLPPMVLASSLYWQLRRAGISLRLIPTSVDLLFRRGTPEVMAGIPTVQVEAPLLGGWDYWLKRLVDGLAAFLALVLLAPLFVAIAIAIKLTTPGPIFFRQDRIGLHGRVFLMWKFRTMVPHSAALQFALEADNQHADGVLFKLQKDPRITPLGHFLRRTSLDELPQLINVLLGQMSLVGPRPLPRRDVARFDPWHHTRHQVLPGITGLWQVSGRSDLAAFNDAARLDLYYIDNWSLNLDLEILLETVRIVLLGQGSY
jgi:exopolysaccharide biosynthesis polyprenyl glycosylphosphotransferase